MPSTAASALATPSAKISDRRGRGRPQALTFEQFQAALRAPLPAGYEPWTGMEVVLDFSDAGTPARELARVISIAMDAGLVSAGDLLTAAIQGLIASEAVPSRTVRQAALEARSNDGGGLNAAEQAELGVLLSGGHRLEALRARSEIEIAELAQREGLSVSDVYEARLPWPAEERSERLDRAALRMTDYRAEMLFHAGNLTDAQALQEQILIRTRTLFGEGDPDTLVAVSNFARTLGVRGDPAKAERMLRRVIDLTDQREALDLPRLVAQANLARVLLIQDRHLEAAALLAETTPDMDEQLGDRDHRTLAALIAFSEALLGAGNTARAQKPLLTALEGSSQRFGAEHPLTLQAIDLVRRLAGA